MNDGRYTLVYPNGDYRTVQVKTLKKGGLANRTILKIKEGRDFTGVGFLNDGKVNFWNRFKAANPAQRLVLIQKAVDRIVADPEAAGMAYAMNENRCYRCGKELTVPASIHKGMGPECARRSVTSELNKQAYDWRKRQAPKPQDPTIYQSWGGQFAQDDLAQKNLFAEQENEQEARAHMSGPDYYNPNDSFWSEPCGICKVPRNQCSC